MKYIDISDIHGQGAYRLDEYHEIQPIRLDDGRVLIPANVMSENMWDHRRRELQDKPQTDISDDYISGHIILPDADDLNLLNPELQEQDK